MDNNDREQQEELKRKAAHHAATFVASGMIIGLGAGSTAAHAIRRIAELLRTGALRDIKAIPCSESVKSLALRLRIPLLPEDSRVRIDLTIDGADEVAPSLALIKGGGGALLREKIVAQSTQREIIIIDESKLSQQLGTQWPVPVETTPFRWQWHADHIRDLGADVALRTTASGDRFRTDQGNYILDCNFGPIADPVQLAHKLNTRAGIIEHGLFLDLTTDLIVATRDAVHHIRRGEASATHPVWRIKGR